MGAVSQAIASAALSKGAEIATDAEVKSIIIDNSGATKGVVLSNGTQIDAPVCVPCLPPQTKNIARWCCPTVTLSARSTSSERKH